MIALRLRAPADIAAAPLSLGEIPRTAPGPEEVLLRVSACGVCHTDLHIIAGELPPHKLLLLPGRQMVGRVAAYGPGPAAPQGGEHPGRGWCWWWSECWGLTAEG